MDPKKSKRNKRQMGYYHRGKDRTNDSKKPGVCLMLHGESILTLEAGDRVIDYSNDESNSQLLAFGLKFGRTMQD